MYFEKTSVVIALFFRTAEERKEFVKDQRYRGLDEMSISTIFIPHQPESRRYKVVYAKQEFMRMNKDPHFRRKCNVR